MAFSLTPSQKNDAKQSFYRKLMRVGLARGLDHIRPTGQGPILTDREGWQYRFALTFSSDSSGATYGQHTVTVCPPSWRGLPSHTFNAWSWTGSDANRSLADFWRALFRRGRDAELHINYLRGAYATAQKL